MYCMSGFSLAMRSHVTAGHVHVISSQSGLVGFGD